jgi:predicted dehydrogenase
MDVFNPIAPHIFHWITVRGRGRTRRERVRGESSYAMQLRAFVSALQSGSPPLTDARDGIANMAVIDRIYQAAGLPVRRPARDDTS